MFTDEQKKALAANLDKHNVKTRSQSGRGVSYVEGWLVIAEANRIFGFDGWTRETVEIRCVSEREREIGAGKTPGWGVSYIAKVRITAFAGDTLITREGCGAGHGIDRDLGQAHESALKEAETDAMKRGLMTFGNPFGLALYDKQQTHVGDDPPPAAKPPTTPPEGPPDFVLRRPPAPARTTTLSGSNPSIALSNEMLKELKQFDANGNALTLKRWFDTRTAAGSFETLDEADYTRVKEVYRALKEKLNSPEEIRKAG